jgi:hypothetical protein
VVLEYRQPNNNHNGGQLKFGPDGRLYIAVGDGGGANDPYGYGQALNTHLGKLLRIDVDSGDPYAVPDDNPFLTRPNAKPEIWAYGLRNPWRFSFDRETGDLYIADVGQNDWEEVDFAAHDAGGGQNYGWNVMEGTHCFRPENCDRQGKVLPVAEYSHSGGGCSITGGYVYRGDMYPGARGLYIYGDWCSQIIYGLSRDDAGEWRNAQIGRAPFGNTTFGQDEAGELYVAGGTTLARIEFSAPTPEVSATPTATSSLETPEPTTATPTQSATATATETAVPEPSDTATAVPPPSHIPVALNQ